MKSGRTSARHSLWTMCASFSSTLSTSNASKWPTLTLISQACLKMKMTRLNLKKWPRQSKHLSICLDKKSWCTIWAISEEMRSLTETQSIASICYRFCNKSALQAWCRMKNQPPKRVALLKIQLLGSRKLLQTEDHEADQITVTKNSKNSRKMVIKSSIQRYLVSMVKMKLTPTSSSSLII